MPPALPFDKLLKAIDENNSFALFCHINPDGDCIGAMLALRIALRQRGKQHIAMLSEDSVPRYFRFLPETAAIRTSADGIAPPDAAILLDCGSRKRAGESFFPLLDSARHTLCIDHHISNDGFCNLNLIDPDASSTCEILYRFFRFADIPISPDIAACLYTGIMFDTGRFKHSNTTHEVFETCSRLVAAGADPGHIATHVYDHRGISHLKLLGHALDNLQTTPDRRIAWIAIDRATFNRLGAEDEDTEGIVETIGAYEECEVHILFTEASDGRSRASMRSRGRVDVNALCAAHNGGGHRLAAGFRSIKPLAQIVDEAIPAATKALKQLDTAPPDNTPK